MDALALGEGFAEAFAVEAEGAIALPGFAELKDRPPPDLEEKIEYGRLAAAAGCSSLAMRDIELWELMCWRTRRPYGA